MWKEAAKVRGSDPVKKGSKFTQSFKISDPFYKFTINVPFLKRMLNKSKF